jgi:hypothetical protein
VQDEKGSAVSVNLPGNLRVVGVAKKYRFDDGIRQQTPLTEVSADSFAKQRERTGQGRDGVCAKRQGNNFHYSP